MHRIHSTAKVHALERAPFSTSGQVSTPPPTSVNARSAPQNAVPGSAVRSATGRHDLEKQLDGTVDHVSSGSNDRANDSGSKSSPADPHPGDTKEAGVESPTIGSTEKPDLWTRAKAGSRRFVSHTKDALLHSWINVLLIFVPIGIAVDYAPLPASSKPTIVFAMNAVAIIPLAGLLSHATESVASRMGDTLASLLNVTFGNAVELIIFIIALAKNEIRIVQASILGSILANLLLILGMAFVLGGLRYQEQIYNSTVTQMSACLLSLSVVSLLLPTAFHASFSSNNEADEKTLKISRGTSVVLLLVYVLYLLFQLKSHAYLYESTPQQIIDEESHPGVLAEMMDHSSSSDSSSSSSSDSDSSDGTGSHSTAARRIKRAFKNRKHRKSSTSSVQAAPVEISAVSSPSTEGPSGMEGKDMQRDGYFDGPHVPTDELQNTVLSGNEADTDGEHERGVPRVRDFETEQGSNLASPEKSISSRLKRRMKKSKKIKSKAKKRQRALEEAKPPAPVPQTANVTEAGPVQSPLAISEESRQHPSTRRPFQISRQTFLPPMPSVLSNTVFSNPPSQTPGKPQTSGLAVARGPASGLRRTSSLPDRLSRQSMSGRQHANAHNTGESSQGHAAATTETEATVKDKDDEEGPVMSRTAAVMLLLVSTGLVAFCAELLVDVIPDMVQNTNVSQAFIGLIVLPIVGNAAEHVTAVTVAAKNKMDLAIGVAVGSSIQIALFITPVVVLIGWIMQRDMSLYFNLFETISLFVTAFVVNFLVLDGRSNYLEGSLLMAAYVIIALAAFFYPNSDQQSAIGGATGY